MPSYLLGDNEERWIVVGRTVELRCTKSMFKPTAVQTGRMRRDEVRKMRKWGE